MNNVLHRGFSVALFFVLTLILGSGIVNEAILLPSVYSRAISQNERTPSIGVNMHGYYTSMAESRNLKIPFPENYYVVSFRVISQAGMNTVRYVFTWEAYEKNPLLFMNELSTVAQTADRFGLKVIYANDQYLVSSWLNTHLGYGFPSVFFLKNITMYPKDSGGSFDSPTVQNWWTDWYNRSIKDNLGNDGWTLQANFLKKIAKAVDNHTSTMGYEILNEPEVYSVDQWEKLGKYNTFMTNELRTVTHKIIVFDRQLPSDVGGSISTYPENMMKIAPSNTTNVIFKTTLYGLPTHCSYAESRLNTAAKTAELLRVPIWIGEFNNGITRQHPVADINQTDVNLYIEKFKEIGAWGWSFWIWSFIPHPSNVKNYNLVNFTANGMQTTKYFEFLRNTVNSSINNENTNVIGRIGMQSQPNTVCPTVSITEIDGKQAVTDLSHPLVIPVSKFLQNQSVVAKIPVNGKAYGVESNITIVQVRLDDSPYISAVPTRTQPENENWLNWTALVPITNGTSGTHRITARAIDNLDNHKYDTAVINFIQQK